MQVKAAWGWRSHGSPSEGLRWTHGVLEEAGGSQVSSVGAEEGSPVSLDWLPCLQGWARLG